MTHPVGLPQASTWPATCHPPSETPCGSPQRPEATPMDVESDDVCWICLDATSADQELVYPCKCPRTVHPRCMARWQLQQAGRNEETHCRFCNTTLVDWKKSLTPSKLKPELGKVQPMMVVYFDGEIHRIPVRQGNEGLEEFQSRIREKFNLPPEVDISLTFGCKEPMTGRHLKLEGAGAFDAAVHCAGVAAANQRYKEGKTGRISHDCEPSDEEEDTTDLLESTLGGPVQPPSAARAAAAVASGRAAATPVARAAATPVARAAATPVARAAATPVARAAATPVARAAATPVARAAATPVARAAAASASGPTASQRQQLQPASPLRMPPPPDWRTTMLSNRGARNALPPDFNQRPSRANIQQPRILPVPRPTPCSQTTDQLNLDAPPVPGQCIRHEERLQDLIPAVQAGGLEVTAQEDDSTRVGAPLSTSEYVRTGLQRGFLLGSAVSQPQRQQGAAPMPGHPARASDQHPSTTVNQQTGIVAGPRPTPAIDTSGQLDSVAPPPVPSDAPQPVPLDAPPVPSDAPPVTRQGIRQGERLRYLIAAVQALSSRCLLAPIQPPPPNAGGCSVAGTTPVAATGPVTTMPHVIHEREDGNAAAGTMVSSARPSFLQANGPAPINRHISPPPSVPYPSDSSVRDLQPKWTSWAGISRMLSFLGIW